MSNYQQDANDWLMSGGVPWAKFEDFGDTVTGTIDSEPQVRPSRDYDSGEAAHWPDGQPITELTIILTGTGQHDPAIEDDDGRRQFVVNSQSKKQALREAVQKAGAKGLAKGGRLQVTYTHDGEPKKRGFRGAKQFTARYAPPPAREVPIDADPRGRQQPYDPRPARSAAFPVQSGGRDQGWPEERPEQPAAQPWEAPQSPAAAQGWPEAQPTAARPWDEPALPGMPRDDEPPF